MLLHIVRTAVVGVAVTLVAQVAFGQQAHVGVPWANAGDGFHENIGLGWGVQGNGWFFNFPGPAPAPFGGGMGGGASFGGGGFRLTAEQGASRGFTSQAPSVTVMNGGMGYFSDTQIRPFVTGLIPVVGNMPSAPPLPMIGNNNVNPVLERLGRIEAEGRVAAPAAAPAAAGRKPAADAPLVFGAGAAGGGASSAERGDLSVAEIKARRAAEASQADDEVATLLAKGDVSLADGKPGVAKVYYQMAARRATVEQQAEVRQKLEALAK